MGAPGYGRVVRPRGIGAEGWPIEIGPPSLRAFRVPSGTARDRVSTPVLQNPGAGSVQRRVQRGSGRPIQVALHGGHADRFTLRLTLEQTIAGC